MRVNPEQGAQFAQMLVQDEEPLADINQVSYCRTNDNSYHSALSDIALLLSVVVVQLDVK